MDTIPTSSFTIISGEPSGERYGGDLAQALHAIDPDISIEGVGGETMRQAGVQILHPVSDLSIMGIGEVIRHIPKIITLRNRLLDRIFRSGTAAVVLIDFPDFNLSLAQKIFQRKKKLGLTFPKIYYFIPPQVWIWRKNRIRRLKTCCDAVFPLFAFEHELYTRRNVRSYYFGHPLNDTILQNQYYEKPHENQVSTISIGLFSGSRPQEVARILPVMLAAVRDLANHPTVSGKNLRIHLSRCPWINDRLYSDPIRKIRMPESVSIEYTGDTHRIITASDLILCKSGTVNLEIARHGKPFAVVYKTSFLTWLAAKLLIRLRHISLVNMLSEKEIVREFVQFHAKPKAICDEMIRLLSDHAYAQTISDALTRFTDRHVPPSDEKVAVRIARIILEDIKKAMTP